MGTLKHAGDTRVSLNTLTRTMAEYLPLEGYLVGSSAFPETLIAAFCQFYHTGPTSNETKPVYMYLDEYVSNSSLGR